jgi:hypothetical protein
MSNLKDQIENDEYDCGDDEIETLRNKIDRLEKLQLRFKQKK